MHCSVSRRRWLSLFGGVLVAGACHRAWGDDKPKKRKRYMGRLIAETMTYHGAGWLMRPEREEEERASKVIEQLAIKPGWTICDMGCGNGFYTIPMAKLTGAEGKVFAVDIQPEMLDMLGRVANDEDVENIEPILGKEFDPQLPAESVDLLLMVDVYHEFAYPEPMLQAIRAALKPDGVVALAEYREEDPEVPIRPLHKMSKKQIMKEYQANGFRLVREYDELPWQHLMFFGRDDESEARGGGDSDPETESSDEP
jgi:ubiquinone/menaquinone biosynthesis C-methylase UbiE